MMVEIKRAEETLQFFFSFRLRYFLVRAVYLLIDTALLFMNLNTCDKRAFVKLPPAREPVHCYSCQKRTVLFDLAEITKLIDRQARHILSQYFDEIEHVSGERNTVPDALSGLELAIFDHRLPDLDQWAIDQASDMELQDIITGKTESSLELDARQTMNGPVISDIVSKVFKTMDKQENRCNPCSREINEFVKAAMRNESDIKNCHKHLMAVCACKVANANM